ncbi:MAG: HEPN domain-containing protein [Chloroflexi bacterium]|nr:HEPN domain-containing protein [Chloroflexota bacterium]
MTMPKSQATQKWFIIVESDLATAVKAASEPDPHYDTAMYHCQQAGEKAVKRYLVFYEIEFQKTHDIEALIELAVDVDPTWEDWLRIGNRLTPYASQYRYPDLTADVPTKAEYEYAYQNATALYNFVLSLLPPQAHPHKNNSKSATDTE